MGEYHLSITDKNDILDRICLIKTSWKRSEKYLEN